MIPLACLPGTDYRGVVRQFAIDPPVECPAPVVGKNAPFGVIHPACRGLERPFEMDPRTRLPARVSTVLPVPAYPIATVSLGVVRQFGVHPPAGFRPLGVVAVLGTTSLIGTVSLGVVRQFVIHLPAPGVASPGACGRGAPAHWDSPPLRCAATGPQLRSFLGVSGAVAKDSGRDIGYVHFRSKRLFVSLPRLIIRIGFLRHPGISRQAIFCKLCKASLLINGTNDHCIRDKRQVLPRSCAQTV
jgi:hypothetical protein